MQHRWYQDGLMSSVGFVPPLVQSPRWIAGSEELHQQEVFVVRDFLRSSASEYHRNDIAGFFVVAHDCFPTEVDPVVEHSSAAPHGYRADVTADAGSSLIASGLAEHPIPRADGDLAAASGVVDPAAANGFVGLVTGLASRCTVVLLLDGGCVPGIAVVVANRDHGIVIEP